jgi:hypothetical protein
MVSDVETGLRLKHNEVTDMTSRKTRRVPTVFTRGRAAMVALSALLIGACTLSVEDPDVALPDNVGGKAGLPTQLAAAVGDFQVAFSGTGGGTGAEGLANMTGLLTDEFFFTETFPTRVQVDKRNVDRNNSTMGAIFFNVQRARASAFRAQTQFADLAPTDSSYSEALSLDGFSWLMMAEAYCSGVPVSHFDEAGKLVAGTPLTTQQLLDTAIVRFTLARQIATGTKPSTFLENLARVGNARALMFKGNAQLAAASTLVASVPTSFEYRIFSSANTDRQNNGLWEFNWNEGRWTQANSEGVNGLPFRNGDPRTPFVNLGVGFDQSTALFGTLKYADRDASTVLADGVEARLIQAEASLAAGQNAAALSTLNTLRAAVTGLTPLTDAGTATARQDQLFRERAFWLYLTGHRLGDLRRLSRAAPLGYGRSAESVFPTGTYRGRGGGVYGTDVNFPVPIEEEANPNFTGCLDRNP